MADEKTPKPKIELGEKPDERDRRQGAPDEGSYTVGDAARDGAKHVRSWVSRTFPGHEHAFWGGVLGLLVAVAFFVLGLFRTIVIVVLVFVGVAMGLALDGDSRLMDALRRVFSRNQ